MLIWCVYYSFHNMSKIFFHKCIKPVSKVVKFLELVRNLHGTRCQSILKDSILVHFQRNISKWYSIAKLKKCKNYVPMAFRYVQYSVLSIEAGPAGFLLFWGFPRVAKYRNLWNFFLHLYWIYPHTLQVQDISAINRNPSRYI